MGDEPSQPDIDTYEPVLTISASFGCGGSVITPLLAERFSLPFVDRLLTVDVAEEAAKELGGAEPAGARSAERVTDDEKAASPGNRLFTYLARAASVGTITSPMVLLDTDDELREHAEESLAGIGSGKGAVILGRAAAVILAGRPRAMHVRLDGPAERRIRAAASIDGVPESVAAEHQAQTDKSRELWVKRLYRADPTDPKWYHLWIDATRFDNDGLVALISTAFERFLRDNWA
jgi:cytidylate kinase